MKKFGRILFYISFALVLLVGGVASGENAAVCTANAPEDLPRIKVAPVGRTQDEIDAAKSRVEQSATVQKVLRNVKYRLISFNTIDVDAKKTPAKNESLAARKSAARFRVVFYDYTNERTIIAEGDFAGEKEVVVSEANFKPNVGDDEFEAAANLIKTDAEFADSYRADRIKFYKPMPPVSIVGGERLVNVGVAFSAAGENAIVGVSFKNERIVEYKGGAPQTSKAVPQSCGITDARQGSTASGTAGQYRLTVSQANGAPLWEMLVVRPSASSGNLDERSGVEIRDVRYKGKSVLKRAHAPILDVQYDGDFCGPFRDFQYAESFFNAPSDGATDPAPGIRVLAAGQIAQTALDSGIDRGNFQGVAVYTQDVGNGLETVLVSEMEAGWYRYIMEWRFAPDGTIRPRFGFGATNSSCVCATHRHHVYWRFDFDVVSPTNKVFQVERNRKFLQPIFNETARLRRYGTNRSFLIQNSTSDEAYLLVPNISDGETDAFAGSADVWLLKYKSDAASGEPIEIDDPNPETGNPNADVPANLSPFVNNESLLNQDVVVWYAAHFVHSDGGNLLEPNHGRNVLTTGEHVVGPDLRAVRW